MADSTARRETVSVGGRIIEFKENRRDGVRFGIVAGHIAAWEPDQGGKFGKPDKFHRGAFLKSIQAYKDDGNRPINLRDHHGRTIGMFPIETVHEDGVGLYGEGEINLEVSQGSDAYMLAKQGALSDFSIGFVAIRDDRSGAVRDIFEADIIEGSIIDDPMNRSAKILEVKSAVPFQDLPLAPQDMAFNEVEAKQRIEAWTGTKAALDDEFAKRFLWHDVTRAGDPTAYLHPIADAVDEKIMAIPQAIFKAAAALVDGEAGIPPEDRPEVINHLERYYAKLGVPSPFAFDEKQFFGSVEVADLDRRSLERVLIQSGRFSKKAATHLAAVLREPKARYDERVAASIIRNLREAARSL